MGRCKAYRVRGWENELEFVESCNAYRVTGRREGPDAVAYRAKWARGKGDRKASLDRVRSLRRMQA